MIYNVDFYPKNSGLTSDFTAEFSLESALLNTGNIEINFPSGYTIPTLTTTNFILNIPYNTINKTGQKLTITPLNDIPSGKLIEMTIKDMTVPSTSGSLDIKANWKATVLVETNDALIFNPTGTPSTSLSLSLQHFPKSACAPSTLVLDLTSVGSIATTDSIYIRFPVQFPDTLGDITAYSTGSVRGDQILQMQIAEREQQRQLQGELKDQETKVNCIIQSTDYSH